jgi:hypothetical protein
VPVAHDGSFVLISPEQMITEIKRLLDDYVEETCGGLDAAPAHDLNFMLMNPDQIKLVDLNLRSKTQVNQLMAHLKQILQYSRSEEFDVQGLRDRKNVLDHVYNLQKLCRDIDDFQM